MRVARSLGVGSRRDGEVEVNERVDVLRAVPTPPAVGGDPEVVDEPLRGDDACLGAHDAVAEVQQSEVQASLRPQRELPERLEEPKVDRVALDREMDPVERAAQAQREGVRDLDERLRAVRPLPVMPLVPVAEVVSELYARRNGAAEAHESLDDARPRISEPMRHDLVEHGELEVRVPLDGELVMGDGVEERRQLAHHRGLVQRLDAGLVLRSDERGDRRERRRQRHLEATLGRDQAVALAAGERAVGRDRSLRVSELLEAQRVRGLVVTNS